MCLFLAPRLDIYFYLLLVWVTWLRVIFSLLCWLYIIFLDFIFFIWFLDKTTFFCFVFSLLFCRGLIVHIFCLVLIWTIFYLPWSEFIFLLLSWCASSTSSLEMLLKGMLKFQASYKLSSDLVGFLCLLGFMGLTFSPTICDCSSFVLLKLLFTFFFSWWSCWSLP